MITNLKKEIGGDFKIKLPIFTKKIKNIHPKMILLSNGSDCIDYIIKSQNITFKSKVLVPSYLCDSILEPLKKNNIGYKFYKLNNNLEPNLTDIKNKLKDKSIKLLFLINYFGKIQPKIKEIKKVCEKRKIKLVEDNVQSFISSHIKYGDFNFNSYRKFLPVPDGAFLIGDFKKKILPNTHTNKFYKTRLYEGILKLVGFKKLARKLIIRSEEKLINNYRRPKPISKVSKYIIERTNFNEIHLKRKKNYNYVLSQINRTNKLKPVITNLTNEECPLGFPVLFQSNEVRNEIRQKLIQNKIYPPIHWALPEEINCKEFENCWKISKTILTIPIDQRYSQKDIKKIMEIILKNV